MTAPPTRHRAADHAHADAGRRTGYVVAMIVNGILLWGAHQLLDWGWPGFLTQNSDRLLAAIVGTVIALVVHLVRLVRPPVGSAT